MLFPDLALWYIMFNQYELYSTSGEVVRAVESTVEATVVKSTVEATVVESTVEATVVESTVEDTVIES